LFFFRCYNIDKHFLLPLQLSQKGMSYLSDGAILKSKSNVNIRISFKHRESCRLCSAEKYDKFPCILTKDPVMRYPIITQEHLNEITHDSFRMPGYLEIT